MNWKNRLALLASETNKIEDKDFKLEWYKFAINSLTFKRVQAGSHLIIQPSGEFKKVGYHFWLWKEIILKH